MARLILSRRVGESIHIGDEVTVTVLGIRGRSISVAIHAPREVPIRRAELRPRTDPTHPGPVDPTAPEAPETTPGGRACGPLSDDFPEPV